MRWQSAPIWKLVLAIALGCAGTAHGAEVLRESATGFPLCVPVGNGSSSIYFRWSPKYFAREIRALRAAGDCRGYRNALADLELQWDVMDVARDYPELDPQLRRELKQVEQGAKKLHEDLDAEDWLRKNPITRFDKQLNRELSSKYGQIFAANVFKAHVEQQARNRNYLQRVLETMRRGGTGSERPLAHLKGQIKLVVSLGLGWEERYGISAPWYLEQTLEDMKALGLDVHILKRDPFGALDENIQTIVPELKEELAGAQDIVFVSLCKGTPELLAALAEINKTVDDSKLSQGRILGYINLSGMLGGAINAEASEQVVLPRLFAPLLRLIPVAGVSDFGGMIGAIDKMKAAVVEKVLEEAAPHLDKDMFYVNVTGAPMSASFLKRSSPLKPVIWYNNRNAFVEAANDGFLELPDTLIPESISTNQVTLVFDSSHMLLDGEFHGHDLADRATRRRMYYAVLKEVLKRDWQYVASVD